MSSPVAGHQSEKVSLFSKASHAVQSVAVQKKNGERINRHDEPAGVKERRHVEQHDSPEGHAGVEDAAGQPVKKEAGAEGEDGSEEAHAKFAVPEDRRARPHGQGDAGAFAEVARIEALAPFVVVSLVGRKLDLADVGQPQAGEDEECDDQVAKVHCADKRDGWRAKARGATLSPNRRQLHSASASATRPTPTPMQMPAATSLGQCAPV